GTWRTRSPTRAPAARATRIARPARRFQARPEAHRVGLIIYGAAGLIASTRWRERRRGWREYLKDSGTGVPACLTDSNPALQGRHAQASQTPSLSFRTPAVLE